VFIASLIWLAAAISLDCHKLTGLYRPASPWHRSTT
jgi:hypothetical protein